MANDEAIRAFWERCRAEDAALPEAMPEAWPFGMGEAMADELGALVVAGTKTATCSALWEYEHDASPLPTIGELGIVLDGRGEPLCLVETTDVRIMPMHDVPAEHAFDEGEGDRSLTYWREAHWAFFAKFLPRIGREPAEDMPLVCERFRVVALAG